MMNLQDITDERCPTCNSHIVAERKERQHCNGHWNETRTFACGCTLTFSPNFMAVRISCNCPKSPEEIARKDQRQTAIRSVCNYIEQLKCEDMFKKQLTNAVVSCKNYF